MAQANEWVFGEEVAPLGDSSDCIDGGMAWYDSSSESMCPIHQADEILIVDDLGTNIDVLANCLAPKYRISASQDSRLALQSLEHITPSLILLDIFMPIIDGYNFCLRVKSDARTKSIPIIFITSASDSAHLRKAFELGAVDFIAKPISPPEVNARVETHLRLKAAEDALQKQNAILEYKVLQRTKKIRQQQEEVLALQKETILRLCLAAELRDNETGMHVRRIQKYSGLLGELAKLPEHRIRMLSQASAMHDLGKIGIPDNILLKPGRLTDEEFGIMKTHTVIGARGLANSRYEMIRMAEAIALNHHERWDGKGYPNGLAGEDIPVEARIVSIVDSFDAMLSKRPYKEPMSASEAVSLIKAGKGTVYDPKLVDTFLANIERFKGVAKEMKG